MEAIDLPTADTAESAPDTTNNTAPLDPCSSLALWAGLLDISNRRTLRRVANERMSGPPVRKPNSAHPARMFTRSLAASVDRSPSSVRAPTNQRHWNSRLHPRGLSRAYPGTGYVPGNWALGSWACLSDMNDDARRILSFFFFFFFASSHRIYPFAQAARKLSLGCAASPSRLESAQPAIINQTRELRDGEACRLTYKPGGIARSTPNSPLTS